ncbi:hypothetical protein [Paraburkholderia sartisoli]|uniref:Uncharacterized protein n=1 Tax=Paraburkholderia sartisoli TaxID=83784 RepID=A0A1H3Z783_9BURK|nr:hypothetical protein [Paraburkholderia sartisoli]SEA19234.1 hypothetical protein SAMN05192564_101618 [Paraburkholderia sartisoli]
MFFKQSGRLANWLFHSQPSSVPPEKTTAAADSSAFAFDPDPAWHGDHWQNLLSSPMDARRYVMEDWSVHASFGFDEADPVPTGAG